MESFFGHKQSEDPAPVFSQLFETANKMMQRMPEIPRISSVMNMNMDMNPFSKFMNLKVNACLFLLRFFFRHKDYVKYKP